MVLLMLIKIKGRLREEKSAISLKRKANIQKTRDLKINPSRKIIRQTKESQKEAVGIEKSPATHLIKNQKDTMSKNHPDILTEKLIITLAKNLKPPN